MARRVVFSDGVVSSRLEALLADLDVEVRSRDMTSCAALGNKSFGPPAVHADNDALSLVVGRSRLHLDLDDVMRRMKGGRNQALARACDAGSGLRVLDACAGWGTDGLSLAGWGCRVTFVEAQPLVAMLLADRVDRFQNATVCEPLTTIHADVRELLRDQTGQYDVIFIDPMFPAHPKTAKPALRMQVLGELGLTAPPSELLELALGRSRLRVVVKTRAKGAPLSGVRPPAWQIRAKSVRFDVYRVDR